MLQAQPEADFALTANREAAVKTVKPYSDVFPGILGNKPPKFWETKRPGHDVEIAVI
jgi:hypothetical protein